MTEIAQNIRSVNAKPVKEIIGVIEVDLGRDGEKGLSNQIAGVKRFQKKVRTGCLQSDRKIQRITPEFADLKRMPFDLFQYSLHVDCVERA